MTLSNVLPGFRQLRAPLAAGYLWVLFIYLVADLGEVEPRSGILKEIADLGGTLSPVGIAVAVSFSAYLIGSFSQWLTHRAVSLPNLYGTQSPTTLSSEGYGALEDLLAPRVASGTVTGIDEARRLGRDVMRELDLIKTRLLGQEPELHAEIDRLHAEAEFRFALLAPLTAVLIVGVLAIPSPEWLPSPIFEGIAILLVVLLVEVFGFQALGVWQQANDKLVDAVLLERVGSPALERWDRDFGAAI